MKKLLIPAAAVLACTFAQAGPGLMVGVSYNFGGKAGFTFKVLSTDRVDRAAAVVGVSYFPSQTQSPWGIDAGLGYNTKRATVSLSYDFLNRAPQMSLGLNNAKDEPAAVTAAPPAAAPPPPPPPPPSGSGSVAMSGDPFGVFV